MEAAFKSMDLKEILRNITKLGGVVLVESTELSTVQISKELSPSEARKKSVLVPLMNLQTDKADKKQGFATVKIDQIDLLKTKSSWLVCKSKDDMIFLEPDLLKNLMTLKLFSEGHLKFIS